MEERRQRQRHRLAGVFAIMVMIAAVVPAASGGRSGVTISRVMMSARNNTHPLASGLRDLPIVPGLGPVTTNSDRDLRVWFTEPGDDVNNARTRGFICALNPASSANIAAFSPCSDAPQSVYAPNGTYGAVRRYAVNSRLAEGAHTFHVRASVGLLVAPLTAGSCGAAISGGRYQRCGPVTTYTFTIDTTLPVATVTARFAPPLGQPSFGTSWQGYATSAAGGLPGFTVAQALYSSRTGTVWDLGPQDPVYVGTTSFVAEFQASEGNIAEFVCRLDNGTSARCDDRTADRTGYLRDGQLGLVYYEGLVSNGTAYPVAAPNTGPNTSVHTLEVWAVDAGGNVGAAAVVRWTVDRDAPTTLIERRELFDAGARVSTASRVQIPFSSQDGGVFFQCRLQCLDGVAGGVSGGACDVPGVFAPCTSPAQYLLNETLLQQGRRGYVFSVRATDRAANTGGCATATDAVAFPGSHACSSYSWTVDVSTPTTTVAAGFGRAAPSQSGCAGGTPLPGGGCLVNTSSVALALNSSADPTEVSYSCQLDVPVWFPCGLGGNPVVTSPLSIRPYRTNDTLQPGSEYFANLPDGQHFVKVRSTNAHGTTGAAAEVRWLSDTTPPDAVFTRAPADLTRSRGALFVFGVFPAEASVRFECSWDNTLYFGCDSGAVQVLDPAGPGIGGSTGSTGGSGANWTAWTNNNHPTTASTSGGGDVEMGVCPSNAGLASTPIAIECRVTATGLPWESANQVLATPCTLTGGLECRNVDQAGGGGGVGCLDYEVRVLCGQSTATTFPVLANVASSFTLYGDGVHLASAADWTTMVEAQVPADVSVLAIAANSSGDGSLGGVLLSLPTLNIGTSRLWKCIGLVNEDTAPPAGWAGVGFNAALWDDAVVQGFNGAAPWGTQYVDSFSLSSNRVHHLPFSQWIWARNGSSGVAPRRVFCRYDLGTVGNSSTATAVTRVLAEGPNSLYVRATDLAGNVQPTPTRHKWQIDTTAPAAVLLFTPDNTSNVTIPTNQSWPSRVGSADAEFRFDAVGELVGVGGLQRFQGHAVKSRFQLTLDGVVLSGFYCAAGSFLCGSTCRVISVCDRNPTDGVALDPVNATCSAALIGCNGGSRTSPLRFSNLAVAAHTLEVVAIDTIGNVGPTSRYNWVIDSTSPTAAISQVQTPATTGGEFRFTFNAVTADGRFECIRRFQCGVAPRVSTEPTVIGWGDCGAVVSVCESTINHTLRFTDVHTALSVAQTTAVVGAIAAALPAGVQSVQLGRVAQSDQFPFEARYSGGTVVTPGRRAAWDLNSSVIIVLNRTATSAQACLQQCAPDLGCVAATFTGRTSRCLGMSAVVSEWVVDSDSTVSFGRIVNATTVRATDISYTVAVSQPLYGADFLRTVVLAMESASYLAEVDTTIAASAPELLSNTTVFVSIACLGFDLNGGRIGQLPAAVADLLTAVAASTAIAAVAMEGDALHVQLAVATPRATASGVSAQLATAVGSGALFQRLIDRNRSQFDNWGTNATLTVSSAQSLAWLSSSSARSAVLYALQNFNVAPAPAGVAGTITATDLTTVVVDAFSHPSFPALSFATMRFTVGSARRRINQTEAREISTTINSLRFRALLRDNTSNFRVQFTQFAVPVVHRVVSILGLVASPMQSVATTFQVGLPIVNMVERSHQATYASDASAQCQQPTLPTCLVDGQYTFMVRAEDTSGNVGSPTTFGFRIDSTPPLILWRQRPAAITNVQQGRVATFDFQSNEVSDAGLETSRFECGLIAAWTSGVANVLQDCGALPVSFFVASGRYTFGVRAIDAAGNVGPVFTHQFEVDGELPTATIVAGVPSPFTSNQDIILGLNSSEAGTFWCSLEVGDCIINDTCGDGTEVVPGHGNARYVVCSSTVSISALATAVGSALLGGVTWGDPPTLFRFRAVLEDLAGNLQVDPAVSVWTLDTSRSTVSIRNGSKPYRLSAEPAPQLLFAATDSMANRLAVVSNPSNRHVLATSIYYTPPRTECLLLVNTDVAAYSSASEATRQAWGGWASCVAPFTANVTTGSALFLVRVRSSAGALGGSDSVLWTVDGSPPLLEVRNATGATAPPSINDAVLARQGGRPAPLNFTAGYGVARVLLYPTALAASAGVGILVVEKFANQSVAFTITLLGVGRPAHITAVSFHSEPGVSENSTIWASDPAFASATVLSTNHLRATVMEALVNDEVYVRVRTDRAGTADLRGHIQLRFDTYFELYPRFTVSSPAPGGEISRMQCCIDALCTSTCSVCHGSGQPPVCATDCTTAATMNATRCRCTSVAGYANWPLGYNDTSAATIMDNSDGVPTPPWDAPEWSCGHGGRVLSGLLHGSHTFAARTIDQALRSSTTPLVHTWLIDSVPPVVGLVRVPRPVVNSTAVALEFRSTERLSSLTCDLNGAAADCTAALGAHRLAAAGDNRITLNLSTGNGPRRIMLAGDDAAGNPTYAGASGLEWSVDTIPPSVVVADVTTAFGTLQARVETEPGATLICTLTGIPASGGTVSIAACQGGMNASHCQRVSMAGFDGAAAGSNGVYQVRTCGDSPCTVNGRVVYTHVDQPISLYYADPGWVLERHGATTFVARVVSDAVRPESIAVGGWVSSAGESLAAVQVHCGVCAGLCPWLVRYDGIPHGQYTLCVSARDSAGNVGDPTCAAPQTVTTVVVEVMARAASALAADSDTTRADSCAAARTREMGLAIAAAVGFAILTVAISVGIYSYRWRVAADIAAGQKAAAILSSTSGFSDAMLF